MTTSELIIGTFLLLLMFAICFWFGYFIGLDVANRNRNISEDKKNDRSNL